jgi:lipopolysaccharide/colanic/teichoic acid biosynthesis glycosyltransferase
MLAQLTLALFILILEVLTTLVTPASTRLNHGGGTLQNRTRWAAADAALSCWKLG